MTAQDLIFKLDEFDLYIAEKGCAYISEYKYLVSVYQKNIQELGQLKDLYIRKADGKPCDKVKECDDKIQMYLNHISRLSYEIEKSIEYNRLKYTEKPKIFIKLKDL